MKSILGWAMVTALTVWGMLGAAPAIRSDADIVKTFRKKLAKSKLAGEGIEIKVERGVATLTGRTEVMQHKGTATRMAKSSGATEVRNGIVISDAARKSALDRLAAGRARAQAASAPRRSSAPVPVTSQPKASTGDTKPKAAEPAEHVPPPVRRATIKH